MWLISYPAYALVDALNDRAPLSERAQQGLLLDITQAGERLVALGERGHILYSDDQGQRWQQADVPVRVTLTAIDFPTPDQGWAVGHDGVILMSVDGGLSWHKQLDGYEANTLIEQEIKRLLALSGAERQTRGIRYQDDELNYLLEDAELFNDEGASRPFLDVLFLDQKTGLAVGAYGMIFRTEDSGKHWVPWVAHLSNPDNFHINALIQGRDALYMAGEAGSLYRSGDEGVNWVSLQSPYEGPFFGMMAHSVPAAAESLIAFGLRGNAFISQDKGRSWRRLDVGSDASILGASAVSSFQFTLLSSGGELFLFNLEGELLGRSLTPDSSALSGGFTTEQEMLVLVGVNGTTRLNLPQIEWEAP
ncbi:MAG: hypothetical protein KC477_02855 [Oceanospirillaceae bacterium]|nr:hypothetical protein [Oceanospirillaceae bacterium]